MDQATRAEWGKLMAAHVECDAKITALQAEKLELHKQITIIEHADARARLNPDASLNQGIGTR